MAMPQFKVNVTHSGTSTDYTPDPFSQVQVKRRENNYDVATLWFVDDKSQYYEDAFDHFNEVKIYFKDAIESAWTQVFGGYVRQVIPVLNQQGLLPQLICKGYAAALEETHCNRDYGIESSNPSYPRPWNIWKNSIAHFVEKSFAGALTGWGIDNTYVSDFCGTDIKYINNPYRTNLELMDLVCELTSAIGAGTTAGAHWIVDHNKTVGGKPRFLVAKIGDHSAGGDSPETYWPDWWNTDAAGSTLEQGIDFTEYTLPDKSEEFANKVVLITDFRRPSFDYFTNGNTAHLTSIWSSVEAILTGETTFGSKTQVVGDTALKIAPTNPAAAGYAYFRFNPSYSLDTTKIGSAKTIPRLNFYSYKPAGLDETNTSVRLYTTTYNSNYYECVFSTVSQSDDVWAHKSIPIGPYWKSEESKSNNEFQWSTGTGGNWASIAGICFKVAALTYLGVDDLHINGKIARSAYNSYSILGHGAAPVVAAKNEHQKVLIARNAMDDSCIASDDTGFAARIAYAELLRRQKRPKTIIFSTTRDMKTAMAGQKIHVHIGKKADGTFRSSSWENGGDMRILELQEDLALPGGYLFTVTATTDLTNSTPISVPDQYAMWQENMFLNSKEAKNIRSGAEVDLLIPIIEVDYPSDDD